MVSFVLLLPIGGVIGLSYFAWNEWRIESKFEHNFGADWKAQYEMDYGPVSSAHAKVTAAIVGAAVIAFVGIWLYRQLIPALLGTGNAPQSTGSRRRRRKKQN
jgi:hypothetical protein